jgi:hypothetical protein
VLGLAERRLSVLFDLVKALQPKALEQVLDVGTTVKREGWILRPAVAVTEQLAAEPSPAPKR